MGVHSDCQNFTNSWENGYKGSKFLRAGHTAPRGVQRSKFENADFGLKPSYLMLTIMFEPKNIDTSTFRSENLTMSNGGFHLDV